MVFSICSLTQIVTRRTMVALRAYCTIALLVITSHTPKRCVKYTFPFKSKALCFSIIDKLDPHLFDRGEFGIYVNFTQKKTRVYKELFKGLQRN